MQLGLFEKKTFKKTFGYTWPFYLLAIVLPIVGFSYGYGLLHRPRGNELLSVFISGKVNSLGYVDKLQEKLEGTTLRQVDSISCDPSDTVYLEKLTVVGFISCDIMIVPESILSKVKMDSACLELSQTIKNAYLSDLSTSYYQISGKDYGLLYKEGARTYLDDYVTFNNEKQYLFLNASSHNVGEDGLGGKNDTLAFQALRFLYGK